MDKMLERILSLIPNTHGSNEEEATLKRLLAWHLEDVTMLDPSNRAREKIYEKLLESERQK